MYPLGWSPCTRKTGRILRPALRSQAMGVYIRQLHRPRMWCMPILPCHAVHVVVYAVHAAHAGTRGGRGGAEGGGIAYRAHLDQRLRLVAWRVLGEPGGHLRNHAVEQLVDICPRFADKRDIL